MSSTAYILLGSNLGEREKHLSSAIAMTKDIPGLKLCDSSSVYSSEALQMTEGTPSFLNQAIKVETELTSCELLTALETIEQAFGRTDKGEKRSRTIDLDILLYDSEIVDSEKLTIPHPELLNRAFALIPVIEIDPTLIHPLTKKPLNNYLNAEDLKTVRQKETNGPAI